MDKHGFEFALEEVQLKHGKNEPLGWGEVKGLGGREVGVDVGSEGAGEEGVDQERTEIFDEEDVAPCNLRACQTGWLVDVEKTIKGVTYRDP